MSRKTALELERLAGLRLAGEQWAAERTALPSAEETLRADARLLESAAWSTAEQSPALGRMRDADGMVVESAALVPVSGPVRAQGAGLAESLREAPAAWGRTFVRSTSAGSAPVQDVSVQSPALGRMRDAGGAAMESAALVPASNLVLTQGAGLAESLREAPAASGRTFAGSAPADNASVQGVSAQSPAFGQMRDAGGADVKRAESGLAVAEGAGRGAAPALAWGPRAVLPGTGSPAAQTGEEPLSRTAVLNLGDVPAARASMGKAAREAAFALADTPEQSVRLSAALPENGLPASGEAQLASLPRPAGKKEKPDGAEKGGENRSAARRDAQESGTEDFWGLWARRFAGELHSSAEGVHG